MYIYMISVIRYIHIYVRVILKNDIGQVSNPSIL